MSDTPMTREPEDVEAGVPAGESGGSRRNNVTAADADGLRPPAPTPMTREQAWETVRGTLNDYVPAGDDHFEASQALSFLRTEMERLEGERDRWRADADLGNDLQRRDEARIEELETLIVSGDTEDLSAARYTILKRESARAALPDTEGEQDG